MYFHAVPFKRSIVCNDQRKSFHTEDGGTGNQLPEEMIEGGTPLLPIRQPEKDTFSRTLCFLMDS